jgi:hypothetical protein
MDLHDSMEMQQVHLLLPERAGVRER